MTDGLVEAVARGRWERHYPAGRGSLAEKVNTPWEKVTGQSRREYLAEATADLAAIKAQGLVVVQGWQDIASAPRDGSYVLGYGPHETRGSYIDAIHFWRDRWTITWMEGYGEPTHWMPLPAAPIAAAGEG